ncbi:nucleoside 2-deoxyribosyltransferase [Solirubrobacter soli]|uniref:nucleoside 2-deoxyribosyltransferase n=1 Tax=Solirubrobacter soli TaxID=363832 RepID=UPI0003F948BA|nr:nucleoside 2-deoxyribosyltransferase [Solirubrobacter soli]
MDTIPLSDPQRRLVETIYAGLCEAGEWPATQYVDARLDRDHGDDFEVVASSLPATMIISDHSSCRTHVAALAQIGAASMDLEHFVALLRYAAQREREILPPPKPSTMVVPEVSHLESNAIWDRQLDGDELKRLFELTSLEGVPNVGSRGNDGSWGLSLNRGLRRYRDVKDVADYVRRRPEPPSPQWISPPPAQPYVFIVMPFREAWSLNVKDCIEQACREVEQTISGLRWERADDMTETGRITDHIVAAIERADVLVADITGSNANVMFELGYADALNKRIIVLNQDTGTTPFDIKDWRQIAYASNELPAARAQLIGFLHGALRASGA